MDPAATPPSRRRSFPPGWLLAILLAPAAIPVRGDPAGPGVTRVELPEGTIESRRVWLEAPEAACVAYLNAFSTRTWTVVAPSRGAFLGDLFGLDLSPASRAAIADPGIWSEAPGGGFILHPPAALLRQLSPQERRDLYAVLAQWSPNKPERWPLVFPAREPFARLRAEGIPEPVIALVERLSYPFAGGVALSDFSVIAGDHPDRAMLLRLLQATSTVESTLPRLQIRTAARVSDTLAYWTVNHHNPFALPLLEALLESEVADGVELVSVLPGAARALTFSVDAEEVSLDTSLKSLLISASLSSLPRSVTNSREFFAWFDRAFRPVPPPYRYGDVLLLEYPGEPLMPYACAFIAADIVFARDPVGLGLWRFVRIDELLARNPHFAGGRFTGYRLTALPP